MADWETRQAAASLRNGWAGIRLLNMDIVFRVGAVAEQDQFRREDTLRMSPAERILCLIQMQQTMFGAQARPLRETPTYRMRRHAGHLRRSQGSAPSAD